MPVPFEMTILGVNSALPHAGRHPSSQIVRYHRRSFMIDCGEGTQMQLNHYKIKRNNLSDIFITHLHGDHCYGLPGLLTSFALQGRQKGLTLHGPEGIKAFIEGVLSSSYAMLPYPLTINEYVSDDPTTVEITPHLHVHTFPLNHRVPTIGYRFQEVNPYQNIDPEKINEYNLSIEEIHLAKALQPIVRENETILPRQVLFPLKKARSYAYCSDTAYDVNIVPYISGVDLLYHEATYLDDMIDFAAERYHSTISQAIDISLKCEAKALIVGHFSSRYGDLTEYEEIGTQKRNNFFVGEEGTTYSIEAQ